MLILLLFFVTFNSYADIQSTNSTVEEFKCSPATEALCTGIPKVYRNKCDANGNSIYPSETASIGKIFIHLVIGCPIGYVSAYIDFISTSFDGWQLIFNQILEEVDDNSNTDTLSNIYNFGTEMTSKITPKITVDGLYSVVNKRTDRISCIQIEDLTYLVCHEVTAYIQIPINLIHPFITK